MSTNSVLSYLNNVRQLLESERGMIRTRLNHERVRAIDAYSPDEVCRLLNQSLANCIDLEHRAIHAAWNTSGSDKERCERWFQDVRNTSSRAGERIAERIHALGGVAEVTVSNVAERSGLSDFDVVASGARAHKKAIASTLAVFVLALSDDIDLLSRYGDESSQILLTDTMLEIGRYIRSAKS